MYPEKHQKALLADDGELTDPQPVKSAEPVHEVIEVEPLPDHSMLWLTLRDTIGVWLPFLIAVFLWTVLMFLFTNPPLAVIELLCGLTAFIIYRMNVRPKSRNVGLMRFINQILKDVTQFRHPPNTPGRF